MNQMLIRKIWTRHICLVVFSTLLAACASVNKSPGSDLNAMVNQFQHDIRWRYYESATAAVDSSLAPAFQRWLDRAKEKLNVVDWEIRQIEYKETKKVAIITAIIQYYWLPSTVLEEKTVSQVWKLCGTRWLLYRQFGDHWCFTDCEEDPKVKNSIGARNGRSLIEEL